MVDGQETESGLQPLGSQPPTDEELRKREREDVTRPVEPAELEASDRAQREGYPFSSSVEPSASGEGTQIPVDGPEVEQWDARKAAVVGRAVNEDFLDAESDGRLGDQLEPIRRGEESYFEQLYDMNPDHFGSMETSEFIDVAKKLLGLKSDVYNSKRRLKEFSEKHGITGDSGPDDEKKEAPKFTAEQARDALGQLDALMDQQRANPNPSVMEALDQGRRYLETFLTVADSQPEKPAATPLSEEGVRPESGEDDTTADGEIIEHG